MSSPVRLSDDELTAVMRAAQPIAIDQRDAFLRRVASELARCDEVGPGVVYRICTAAQKELMDYPIFEKGRWSKHR
jgi:hypothetical protein